MSEYIRILRKAWNETALVTATLELTYACNLDCAICYNDVSLTGQRMTRADYGALLEALDEIGLMNLTLSGGEPLAHPDFFWIGERARELGFLVRIKTNAHAIGPSMAKKIREVIGPFALDISLHGSTAEVHDAQTQTPGSFDRLMNNLAAIQAEGMRFKLNAPLTSLNEHQVEEMYAIADRFGAPLRFDPQLTPRDDGDQSPLDYSATEEGLKRWRDASLARSRRQAPEPTPAAAQPDSRKQSKQHCGAGSNGVTIDPYGTVLPCVQWRIPMGSLHQQSLASIWRSASAEQVRADNRDYAAAGHGMGSCPGMPPRTTSEKRGRVLPVLR